MSEALEVLLSNRSFLYSYLSRAFAAEPDEGFLEIVRSDHAQEACTFLDGEGDEAGSLQRVLASIASGISDVRDMRTEYTKLFIGPATLPAPPWESVYATGEPLLFQESTLAVREAYRRAGFHAAGYPHEADDHLATELSFMAALAEKTSVAFTACGRVRMRELLSAQADFLERHILTWFRPFADRLEGQGSLYPLFAALGVVVCERDAEVVRELLSSV